jgi:hypothetical protein
MPALLLTREVLCNLRNLQECFVLTVAPYSVYALLRLVANRGDLVILLVFVDYFSSYRYARNRRSSYRRVVAIDDQKCVEAGLAVFNVFDQLNAHQFTLGYEVLFAAGLNYCFFHLTSPKILVTEIDLPNDSTRYSYHCKASMATLVGLTQTNTQLITLDRYFFIVG